MTNICPAIQGEKARDSERKNLPFIQDFAASYYIIVYTSVNNVAITKSIYKDKNNNKFKNKSVKAFCEELLLIYF